MKQFAFVIVGVAIALGAVALGGFLKPVTVDQVTGQSYGAASGPTHTEQQEYLGGVVYKGTYATSSIGTSLTITGGELSQWLKAGTVAYSAGNVAATTITLPASSTIPQILPNAGDRAEFCIRNATTTAGNNVVLAGGTGINMLVASSSASAVGALNLGTGKVACVTLIRGPLTGSAFNIDALVTAFK